MDVLMHLLFMQGWELYNATVLHWWCWIEQSTYYFPPLQLFCDHS